MSVQRKKLTGSSAFMGKLEHWIPTAEHITTTIPSVQTFLLLKTSRAHYSGYQGTWISEAMSILAKNRATISQPHIPANMRIVKCYTAANSSGLTPGSATQLEDSCMHICQSPPSETTSTSYVVEIIVVFSSSTEYNIYPQ